MRLRSRRGAPVSDSMGVGLERWLNAPRLTRIGSLLLMLGSWYSYLRGNDQEAVAILRAGGDAGLWVLGSFLVTAALVPGFALMLLSLIRPWTRFSAHGYHRRLLVPHRHGVDGPFSVPPGQGDTRGLRAQS